MAFDLFQKRKGPQNRLTGFDTLELHLLKEGGKEAADRAVVVQQVLVILVFGRSSQGFDYGDGRLQLVRAVLSKDSGAHLAIRTEWIDHDLDDILETNGCRVQIAESPQADLLPLLLGTREALDDQLAE